MTTLLDLMKEHIDTYMPGFTHLQKAQPVTLAHHIGAYFEMFKRDRSRLHDIHERMNYCPLGAGALLFHAIMEDLLPYMNVYQSSDEDVTYNGKDEPISSPFEGDVEDSTGEASSTEESTAEDDTTEDDTTASSEDTTEGTTEAKVTDE